MTHRVRIRVLHIDDDPDFADVAATFLEREDGRLHVETTTSVSDGLDRLATTDFDCVVSDYDMPGQNGIRFLEAVREEYPDLPFILFTGKGSEGIASDAISAGVTDYLQKRTGTDQYQLLAKRITDAVEHRHAQTGYREMFEKVPDGVVIHDPDDGSFIDMNAQYAELFGYDRDEFLEAGSEVIHPADPPYTVENAKQHVREAVDQGSHTFEWPGVTKDGDQFWTEVHLTPVRLHGAERILAVVREISERKEHERKLERERDRYTTLFENLPNPVVYGRMIDDEAVVQDVNPAFEDTFGYERETVEDELLHDFILPDAEKREDGVEAINRRLRTDGEVHTVVRRATVDDIREFRVDITMRNPDAEMHEGYAIYTDITKRKEREHVLEQLHNATRDLITATTTDEVAAIGSATATRVLELSMNGIHLYDADRNALVPVAWADKSEERFDGSPPELPVTDSLAGRAYRTGDPERYADVREADEAFNSDTPFRSELFLPIGDHGVFIFGSPQTDAFDATDEALAHVLAANVEAALDRVGQRQDLQRERDRLDEFAGIVSHDLRNPLNVAQGRIQLAQAEHDSTHLDEAAGAVDRSIALIDDLLALAREGEWVSEGELVELGELVEDCWRTVETDDATLLAETERTIRADPNRLKQLLENLIRNAVEHAGDDVTVTMGDMDDGFYVEDDGPGIPEGEREQAFESGFSAADAGTGLGLNIVQKIVDGHGWDIAVTESEAGGARFEITDVTTR